MAFSSFGRALYILHFHRVSCTLFGCSCVDSYIFTLRDNAVLSCRNQSVFDMVKFAPEGLHIEEGPFTNPVKIICKKWFPVCLWTWFSLMKQPDSSLSALQVALLSSSSFSLFYPSFSEPVMSRAEPLEKHIVTRRPSDRMNVSLQINYFNWNRYGSATSHSWHPQRPRTVCIF